MTVQVEATYENGMLKLDQPLPLAENERVCVTLTTKTSRVKQSYGLARWDGSLDELDHLISSPENGPWSGE